MSSKSQHVYGLDIFRSVAILLVLMGHSLQHSTPPIWLADAGRIGILGVELFFVLSGFLIGGILLKLVDANQLHSLGDVVSFWKRRWLRTLPLYLIALLAFIRFDYNGRHEMGDFPLYWLFLQNFAWPIPHFFELSWSLSIEENFYFWFPLLYLAVVLLIGRNGRSLLLAVVVFLAVTWGYRWSLPFFTDWDEYNFKSRMVVMGRMDSIMVGVLIAAMKRYAPLACSKALALTPLWAVISLAIAAWYYLGLPGLMSSRPAQMWMVTVQAAIFGLLLPWFDNLREQPATLLGKFFGLTSQLAYSLYLGHILVIVFINFWLSRLGVHEQVYPKPWLLYPILFCGYYLLAWATYRLVEKPFLTLRDNTLNRQNAAMLIAPSALLATYLVLFA